MNENKKKSGFVSIIGKPNAGKSTLLNSIVGEKISAVSKKPQTTRKNQKIIYTDTRGQIVFVDTPGENKIKNKLDEFMFSSIKESFKGIDLILLIVDINSTQDYNNIVKLLKNTIVNIFLVLNKIDTQNEKEVKIDPIINTLTIQKKFKISALKKDGIKELIDSIFEYLPFGEYYYPIDDITDFPLKKIVAEKIRQQALYKLDKEIPHGIAVLIEKMKKDKNNCWQIEAVIYCEKESHKKIIIGKNAQTIKSIGIGARIDIEKFLNEKVNLKTFVSIKKDWRGESILLANFGYKN
ncbi:MAG: GTPase Era [Eubacteriales bacterium]|nr:GTPase Era [Eubacteriales bacterium]